MTVIALPARLGFAANPDWRRLGNWLIVWVLLANAAFLPLWFTGAPPRLSQILAFGVTGLVVKRFGRVVQFAAFAIVTLWSVLSFIANLFNLHISALLYSLQFFAEIKPANSVEYLAAATALLGILVISWRRLRHDSNFSSAQHILLAAVAFGGLGALDYAIGMDMRGHYMRSAPGDAPFASARGRSGFAAMPDGKRHLMLVMVESLGLPKENAEMKRLLFRQYLTSPAIAERYDIKQGISPFYVSTTAGEVRELCGRWGDYYDLVERKDSGCLPAQLAKKGYDTAAFHSFMGDFFARAQWYPNIGFNERRFRDRLMKDGAEYCGGVFAGACDRDVPVQIAARLKAAKKPTFLYFLSLNTHLPVPSGMNLRVDDCARVSAVLAREYPQICRQYALWQDLDRALVKEITAADFPPTDILIVGDHTPPYFDRHHRSQFDPGHVPWLYLSYKGQ